MSPFLELIGGLVVAGLIVLGAISFAKRLTLKTNRRSK